MIIAKKINENLEKFSVSQDISYKSKITKFDGKIIECDAFPSPIGTVCKIHCAGNDNVTGEIIGSYLYEEGTHYGSSILNHQV